MNLVFIHSFIEWRLCSEHIRNPSHWRKRVSFCFSIIRWRFKTISPITESVGPVESGWTCCGLQNHLQSFVYLRLAYLPLPFVCLSVNSVVRPLLAACVTSVFVLFAISAPPPQRTSIKKQIFNVKQQCGDVSGILIFFYDDFRGFQDPWFSTFVRLTSSFTRPRPLPWAHVGTVAVYRHVVLVARLSAAAVDRVEY